MLICRCAVNYLMQSIDGSKVPPECVRFITPLESPGWLGTKDHK